MPCAIRWPGVIKPGTVNNDLFAHEDMLPTLLAAAGVPDVKEQLLKGMKVGDKTFKVHLDGYNITDALAGKSKTPRREFFYFNDDGSFVALPRTTGSSLSRSNEQRAWMCGRKPFVPMRFPRLCNLRSDPFEQAHEIGIGYPKWRLDRAFLLVPAQQIVGKFLATLKDFPPSQKPGSFSLDHVMAAISCSRSRGEG